MQKNRHFFVKYIKISTFAPLFGVTDDRKKSCLGYVTLER